MLIYFFIIFSIYYLIVGFFIIGWQTIKVIPTDECKKHPNFISIVVPVRNEENNIANLLTGITSQSLPKDQFELIIIDDQSEDKTVEIVNEFIKDESLNLRLIDNDYNAARKLSPKKSAIMRGVEEARGEIIVMTDGDCRIGTEWLESIQSSFDNDKVMFTSGAVVLQGSNHIFSKIQSMEFASLIGAGAALINLNYPLMCNGANMAFRKSAFRHVNGYEGNMEKSTGDDVFLMQKIHKSFKNSVLFQKDQRALVYTGVQKSISGLINQRKRWASKWNKHLLSFSWFLPVMLFIHYLTFLVGVIALFIFPKIYWQLGILILIKIIVDYIFLKNVMIFCKLRLSNSMFLLSELLYPFYAIFFGVIVHFGKFTWKGRTHKN